MRLVLAENAAQMGKWSAEQAAERLRQVLAESGQATIVVATGASQFEVLRNLVNAPNIDWSRVTGFHLDEYVGLSPDHPASFCKYLLDRFVSKVPLREFHFLYGDRDLNETISRIGSAIEAHPVDLALVGIGENSHLAFNDPPADFDSDSPYLIVQLDEDCRRQQVGEGWFSELADVPKQAITMSIRQILRARTIICSVPDERKSDAVQKTLEGPITADVPASILRTHEDVMLVVDKAASSKLSPVTLAQSTSVS